MSFDHRRTAAAWHGGQQSPLYAYASTGTVVPGVDDEIWECLGLVERGELDIDLDPVDEHERLMALLHDVEPELAKTRAREVGSERGQSAASWWQQDALGGRATGNTAATARRVLQRIEDGDPAILDTEVSGWDQVPSSTEIATEAGLLEPDLDDREAHERWSAAQVGLCDAYATAFVDAFWQTVAQACRDELGEMEAGPHEPVTAGPDAESPEQPTVDERHLARARFLGGNSALTGASALLMSASEADVVVNGGRHPFGPPGLGDGSASEPTPQNLTREIIGPEATLGLSPEALTDAERAVARAWEEGRDTVWTAALWSAAMRTLGLVEQARFLEGVAEGHVRSLASGVRYRPDTELSEPYIRPVPPSTAEADVPPGWIAEPTEPWAGHEVEVVYDPRRFEVAFTSWSSATGATAAFEAVGWQQRAVDGDRGFWVRDRVVAARAALARFGQDAAGVETAVSLPSATRGLEL